jgi:alkylhydroperoxidase/carboxymuconolactone decarboxylase family protein YurZ
MTLPVTSAVKELDPAFAEMAAASFRLAQSGPELTAREAALVNLVADMCEQTLGMPFELHVQNALETGLDADDLRELFRFVSYDCGYPAALAALERLAEVERTHGLPGPTGPVPEVDTSGTGSQIPAEVRAQATALDQGFADYMDLQSRIRAGISRFTGRERAFATLTVDVLYQTLQESFEAHVGRALAAGATPAQIRAVVRATTPFGMARAWRALIVLGTVLTD